MEGEGEREVESEERRYAWRGERKKKGSERERSSGKQQGGEERRERKEVMARMHDKEKKLI